MTDAAATRTREEHIAEAERLLDGPDESMFDSDDYWQYRMDNLMAAQVHATLALSAATSLSSLERSEKP